MAIAILFVHFASPIPTPHITNTKTELRTRTAAPTRRPRRPEAEGVRWSPRVCQESSEEPEASAELELHSGIMLDCISGGSCRKGHRFPIGQLPLEHQTAQGCLRVPGPGVAAWGTGRPLLAHHAKNACDSSAGTVDLCNMLHQSPRGHLLVAAKW